jgi:hypothetical protein
MLLLVSPLLLPTGDAIHTEAEAGITEKAHSIMAQMVGTHFIEIL